MEKHRVLNQEVTEHLLKPDIAHRNKDRRSMSELANIDNTATTLFEKVSKLIEQARKHVATTVNLAEVYAKYHIGQYIVEEEQEGKGRA